MFKRIFTFVALVMLVYTAQAQSGKIRGSIFDDKTGESLVGVTVFVAGTTKGTTTDLDGKFTLDLDPGNYDIQISYISYQTQKIEDVAVKADEVTLLNNLRLKSSTINLDEVVIVARASRNTEAALNTIKMKSAVIMDGISSDKMQLTGDGSAVEAAKRVTGVSVEGGKYVYVRGLGDRYSKTMLNHMDIPGLDPDRNSLQMDIIPTGLIDNILVSKNFTAEMPADFTGGVMNIETKDFPDERNLSVSVSTAYNPQMHFNSNYLYYPGGKTDFLGFDDGTRALPSGARGTIPAPGSGATEAEIGRFVRSFNPNLGALNGNSLMDYGAGFSLADQISLKERRDGSVPKFGYIFSLTYKNDTRFYDRVEYGEYQRTQSADEYNMKFATRQVGQYGERSALIGGLAGLAYKNNHNKYRLMFMHLQNGESRAGQFTITNDGSAVGQSGYNATSDNLEFNQRSMSNMLLNGTHVLGSSGWEIDWRVSPTYSKSSDPDIRKTAFTEFGDRVQFDAGAGGNPTRIWRDLSELNASAKMDISKKYMLFGQDARLLFGAIHTYKYRSYEALMYDAQFFGTQSWNSSDPQKVLDEANIYPNRPNSLYYQSGNRNPNPNAYSSNVNNSGVYVSNEMNVFPKLKTILGVRAENHVLRHTGRDQTYASGDEVNGRNLSNEKVLGSIDLFPSANFIYSLTERQNLRASYSRTIARPSFKELSFAQILDPITNRFFNGSLFPYPNWNGELSETRVNNVDLRWEYFLERGQIFSASTFFKTFDNPIELVRIPEQQTSTEYQPRNVGDGLLYGVEVEIRKDLSFIGDAWQSVVLGGNFTYIHSQIEMTEAEYNGRKNFAKTGETIGKTRQMAGMSPYVVNASIAYNNPKLGLDVGMFYNMKGPTLSIVGGGLFPDIYDDPFHSLNISAIKRFGKHFSVDMKVSNILDERTESHYKSYRAGDEIFNSVNPGRTFSLGLGYKL